MRGLSCKPRMTWMVLILAIMFFNTRSFAEDRPSNGFLNEAEKIKKFPLNVKRQDKTLYLRLKSGKYKELTDLTACDSFDTCLDYYFGDYMPEIGFYVIEIGYYEGSAHIMVSEATGQEYNVHSYPHLSPDKKNFITVSASEAYNINGVFIWRVAADGIIPEFLYEPKEYALYKFIGWENNGTVKLSKFTYSDKRYCPETHFMTVNVELLSDKNGWKFYEELSPDKINCVTDFY